MKRDLATLSELKKIILQACNLVLYVEVCFLTQFRIKLEKELVIDKCVDRLFIVIGFEISVDKGEVENLASKVFIDSFLIFASDARLDPHLITIGCILALPELDL